MDTHASSASSLTRAGRVNMAATAAILGALFCWSLGPIFIKYLTGPLDSWTQNALRYVVACLFWLPFLVHVARQGRLTRTTWRRARVPALANIIMQSLWAAGFYYLDPAFMTLLTKTSVLWIAGFSLLVFPEERPLARSRRFWSGLLLSLVGMVGVLYFEESFGARGTLIGVAIALAQAFMWGAYTISVRLAFRDTDSRISFSVISIYTMVGLGLGAWLFGTPAAVLQMDLRGWAAVVISGVLAIALGHVFYYAAIRRIGATIPMLVILVQPFAVFGLSSVVFHERLSGWQLFFGVVLLAGAALSVWAQQHLRTPEPVG
jgi:drug/metabolite transporter (DMT)-like permease